MEAQRFGQFTGAWTTTSGMEPFPESWANSILQPGRSRASSCRTIQYLISRAGRTGTCGPWQDYQCTEFLPRELSRLFCSTGATAAPCCVPDQTETCGSWRRLDGASFT